MSSLVGLALPHVPALSPQEYCIDSDSEVIQDVPAELASVARNMKGYVRLAVTTHITTKKKGGKAMTYKELESLESTDPSVAALLREIDTRTGRIYSRVMKKVRSYRAQRSALRRGLCNCRGRCMLSGA